MKKAKPKTEASPQPPPENVVALQVPKDPKRFDKPIAELRAKIASVQKEQDDTTEKLTGDPFSEKLHANLSSIDTELRELGATLARMQRLRATAEESWAEEQRGKYAVSLLVDMERMDAIRAELRAVAAEIAPQFAALKPHFEKIAALTQEHDALGLGILKAGGLAGFGDRQRVNAIAVRETLGIEAAFHFARTGEHMVVHADAATEQRQLQKLRGRMYAAIKAAASKLGVPSPVPPVDRVVVELVAVKDGSLANDPRRILRGTKFMFDATPDHPGGLQKQPPEFALPVDAAEARELLARGFDTRPPDAIQEARIKRGGPVAGESR